MILVKRTIHKGLIAVFLCSCLLETLLVHARSTGAPVESNTEICSTLTPGHQVPAAITACPYSISLDSESYKPGADLNVTVNTDQSRPGLKGIFLQMRNAVTHEILGSWSVTDSTNFQTVSCDGQNDNAVTHRNSDAKALTNTFTWTPPDIGGLDIYVAATFVQDYGTFWVNVQSPVISDACQGLFVGLEMCSNHGTCASKAEGLQCNCEPGYTGFKCQNMETDDPCSGNACMNGATCVADTDGGEYTCTCPQGYTGPMCDLADDPCSGNACMNGATCVADTDGGEYTCTCPQGYTGPMCDLEDPCQNNPCRNGATCRSGSGEVKYTCACAEGFTGPICELEKGVTTQASTTAQGSILSCSIILTVSALGLAVIINKVTLALEM